MAKYRLNAGLHAEPDVGWQSRKQNGEAVDEDDAVRTYSAGEVVESNRDLVKVFGAKFSKVEEEKGASEERKQQVDGMVRGGHWQEDDRAMLEGLSDKDFQRMHARFPSAPAAADVPVVREANRPEGGEGKLDHGNDAGRPVPNGGKSAAEAQGEGDGKADKPPVKKLTSHLGEDVTDKHEGADEAGFVVFRNAAGKHQVVERDHPGKPLNKKPLAEDEVADFVAKTAKDK